MHRICIVAVAWDYAIAVSAASLRLSFVALDAQGVRGRSDYEHHDS